MLIRSTFAGRCAACRHPFAVGDLVNWERGKGSTHQAGQCKPVEEAPAVGPSMDVSGIVALLESAKARGLVWPKARFLGPASYPGPLAGRQELRISLAGAESKNPGAVYVKLAGEYVGLVAASGEARGRLAGDAAMLALLRTIAAEPARCAKEYGAVACACSFCGLQLTDEGSIEAGYGPICADRYGLPHTAKHGKALKPVPVTGEAQPALPGAELVRETENATPAFDAPFSLMAEAVKTKTVQRTLW